MDVQISIVIVNYNVQYFIEQCLNSIFKLSDFKGNIQVIVVDNNSQDASVPMIKENFPKVELIVNSKNVGFSKANNQGIEIANGEYVLLLNPDTIIEEQTLSSCYDYMEEEKEVGVLGVKMVDGGGAFLPESKRGFPTPTVSFFRFMGLHKMFPKSEKFNGYYLGHLDEDEIAEVDVLCGAFMFMRNSDLSEIGNLDEDFFMYGEDIDLSYRFSKGGKKVIYFPKTTIIHFKGESTRKDSIQYTKSFYNAMDIFAKKHFQDTKAKGFLNSLSLIIKFKGILSFFQRIFKAVLLPILDIINIVFGLKVISKLWANFYFQDVAYYDSAPLNTNFIIYTCIWIIALFYAGAYDKRKKNAKIVRNIIIGTIVILAIYGLLGDHYRSSRAIIILASIYVALGSLILRMFFNFFESGKFSFSNSDEKILFIIGDEMESKRIKNILTQSNNNFKEITLLPKEISLFELRELIAVKNANEVICNVKDLGMKKIIKFMAHLGNKVAFKITGEESLAIIGSQSKNKNGEIYTFSLNYAIQDVSKIRMKRTFDIVASILLIIFYPFLLLEGKRIKVFRTLFGVQTLIGYNEESLSYRDLPSIKKGLIPIEIAESKKAVFEIDNNEYAKSYTVWYDIRRLISYIVE